MTSDAITKSITINARPSRIWAVLTTPDLITRWMSDEPLTITSDWHAGAPILMRGTLHGYAFENRGIIQIFDADKTFQYAFWSTLSASRLADLPENYTTVRFDLTPQPETTLLTVTLSDFAEPSIAPHANLYWGGTLPIIKALCEGSD